MRLQSIRDACLGDWNLTKLISLQVWSKIRLAFLLYRNLEILSMTKMLIVMMCKEL